MKLKGKRVERQNEYGDELEITLNDGGMMRLSPGLLSKLKIDKTDNKVGFGYPETTSESLVIYKANDNDGVAVNLQGYLKNIPHNRDLRSYLDLSSKGRIALTVEESGKTFEDYPDMTFHKVSICTDNLEDMSITTEEVLPPPVEQTEQTEQKEETITNNIENTNDIESNDNNTNDDWY